MTMKTSPQFAPNFHLHLNLCTLEKRNKEQEYIQVNVGGW